MCITNIYIITNVWLPGALFFYGGVASVLCWPLGWLIKCCTTKFLYPWNNVVSHTTMLLQLTCWPGWWLLLCIYQSVWFFDYSSRPSFDDFAVLWNCSFIYWDACIFLSLIVVCHCTVLFFVLYLSFLIVIHLPDDTVHYKYYCCLYVHWHMSLEFY